MGLYNVVRTSQFEEMLRQVDARFSGTVAKVNGIVSYLEDKAIFCGISTNRDLRTVSTRAVPGIPSFVIFFNYDEDTLTAYLTHIVESPRNLNAYEDDEEEY